MLSQPFKKNPLQTAVLLGIFSLKSLTLEAQNVQFRQSFAQRVFSNPALIGTGLINDEQTMRISSGTRAQWLGLGKRLFSQSLAFDAPIKETNASFSAGVFTTDFLSGSQGKSKYSHWSGHLGYAYDLKINKNLFLKTGLNVQFSSLNFGIERFNWEDQINATNTGFLLPTQEPVSQLTKNVIHASAGFVLYGSKGFLGVSAFNINQPDISFFEEGNQKLPLNISIMAGYEILESASGTKIVPSLNYHITPQTQIRAVTANILKDNFRMGVGFQNTEALNRQAYAFNYYFGARYDRYYIGYSNDWQLSIANSGLPLTHEISILIFPTLGTPAKRPNPFPEM
jgi:type IX secretion system PorP/SprF family membrane protein